MTLNEEEYLHKRLDKQIDWHERKSNLNQMNYKIITVVNIIIAALIPFITSVPSMVPMENGYKFINFIIGGMGVVVTILSGILALNKFHVNWVQYRSTAESLIKERFMFLTRSEPYHGEEPFGLLVQRVENMLATNTQSWAQHTKAKTRGPTVPTIRPVAVPSKSTGPDVTEPDTPGPDKTP